MRCMNSVVKGEALLAAELTEFWKRRPRSSFRMLSWLRSQQECITCGLARSINVHQCKAVTCLSRENVFKLSRFALAKLLFLDNNVDWFSVSSVCCEKDIYTCILLYVFIINTL